MGVNKKFSNFLSIIFKSSEVKLSKVDKNEGIEEIEYILFFRLKLTSFLKFSLFTQIFIN